MDKYNKIMDLEVIETTPLGDWIRSLLRKSECVCLSGKGSKNVLIELQLDKFQNVKYLSLFDCDSMKIHCQTFPKLERLKVKECVSLQYLFGVSLAARSLSNLTADDEVDEISRRTHIEQEGKMVHVIKFPNLYDFVLYRVECLTHFCSDTVEGIEFPQLRKMKFGNLPEFKNFLPTANNSNNPLFDEKVCFHPLVS